MPLNNNSSYIPVMNEFIAHWTQVNAALAAPLVVGTPDGQPMALADFTALRETLQGQLDGVIDFMNDEEIARGDINLRKAGLLRNLNEFNGLLDGYYSGTPYGNARAYAPNLTAGEEHFISPMRDTFSLWKKLNLATAPPGVTLPLQLADESDDGDFNDRIEALQAAYIAEAKAKQDAILERARRDKTMALARAVMVTYRKVVPSRCSQFPELVDTLPRLSPLPGHTPDAVNASAVFVEPDQSRTVYDESTETTLARYELRGNPGDEYREDDAVVIDTNAPGDPREFITGFGLTQPGTRVALKVYVVLETGNEAGSAEMTVQRPLS